MTDDDALVKAILRRLRPDADKDISQQNDVRMDYLQRVHKYVISLPASYNSLKVCATYRLLEAKLQQGQFDRNLFLSYLRLPRSSPLVNPVVARLPTRKANLSDNFMDMALLPPIRDEQTLVRAHLEHFLKDAADVKPFDQFLKADYLRSVFAETKLLAGVGDTDPWYQMLSPSQRSAIRDRVELRLSSENKVRFDSDEPTELIVDIKNIDELIVRIYEINTLAYYRAHSRPLNTDIDLDGLVATDEIKTKYNQPAVQRHRETIKLPQISGRGVWVVDFVGKGRRSRAMIRRGQLHHVDQNVADGMLFTIVDEDRKPISGAKMFVGSQEFVADEKGRIGLPPVVDHVQRNAIITDGKLAERVSFKHLRESYQLTAAMHLDRTQLQSGGIGKLLVRPRLAMSGQLIDPGAIEEVQIKIVAKDLDNLSTTKTISDLKLDQQGELLAAFRVPSRLAQLSVTLSGKVTSLATNQQSSLQTSQSWQIASIRRSAQIQDAFLTRDGDNYLIEVRGRSGELVPSATVNVWLETSLRNTPIQQTMQTDDNGRISLSNLASVSGIRWAVASGAQHHVDLTLDRVTWPSAINATANDSIRLPLQQDMDDVNKSYRLLQQRSGADFADHSESLSAKDGLLTIAKLPAGDYQLFNRDTARGISIQVVDGPKYGRVVAGQIRHRSIAPGQSIGIASIKKAGDDIQIQLSGETKLARVHVYASRFLNSDSPIESLRLPSPGLYGRGIALPRCGYVSDLRLGDEYQYVLRRRFARKYPGVMLPQPGLILNPWETQETVNTSQIAADGEAPPPSAMAAPRAANQAKSERNQEAGGHGSSDFDFLADPGTIVDNLRPDKNGVVTIPAKAIKGLPLLRIVVSDPVNLVQRLFTQPLTDVETVDQRLAKSIAADKAMSFQRAVSIVGPDKPLDLASLGSAQLQVFGDVQSLMTLYKTLLGDPRLSEFDVLASWNQLDNNQKQGTYAQLACHELHLFLWAHDREFFDETIRPYLANKKEKQFLDHWLLGNDLADYTTLWRYQQLSAAEKALLAIRVPQAREMVRRELAETVDATEENHDVTRSRLESALRLGDMNGNGRSSGTAVIVSGNAADPFGVPANADAKKWNSLKRRRLSREVDKLSEEAPMEESEALYDSMDMFGGRGGALGGGGGFAGKAFYRNLDSTKQWAESHWDRVRTVGGPTGPNLIGVNAFWSDIAKHDAEQLTVSTHLLEPVQNRHSALVALALSGLPLTAGEIGLPTEADKPYAPEHSVAVVTKRLIKLEPADEESNILIGQRFAPLQRRSKSEQDEEPTEFLRGAAYKGQIVISNPTSKQQVVDVFWQIPAGSIPLATSHQTDSRTISLTPFAVQAIEYTFYFPIAGKFVHYPATVASEGKLIAQGTEKTFDVVRQFTEDDSVTWEKIARSGTPDQIRDFLANANLREIDWMLVAHRMKDQAVYTAIIKTLEEANLAVADLWAYALHHRDAKAMKNYLSLRADLVSRVGPVLQSDLLMVDPIERRTHEFLEYAPLVRARIHRLGQFDEILNPTFHGQYMQFANVLAYSNRIAAEHQLALAYYLLLQNRIEESIAWMGKIDRNAIATKLQYDYANAYLAMHQEKFGVAEKIASQYASHPVPRWRGRFDELALQLKQRQNLMQPQQLVSVKPKADDKPIKEGTGDLAVLDRERRQASASYQQPKVNVFVEGNTLRIDHRRTKEVTLNLYGVDLELLFSKAPFVREDLQRMAMVRPTKSQTLSFDDLDGTANFELDDNLRRQTLLVEIIAGASRSTALFYGGEITSYVSESFGQLQATDTKTQRPISTAYVKVYAKYPNGSVRFYKDGYTDSRGRFDYSSISASDARGAKRFAIMVLSDEKGATLHDVAAPNQ